MEKGRKQGGRITNRSYSRGTERGRHGRGGRFSTRRGGKIGSSHAGGRGIGGSRGTGGKSRSGQKRGKTSTGGRGMKGGSKVLIEPHRHEGIFIARGKEDALVTLNISPGVSVYGEKRINIETPLDGDSDVSKLEY